MSETSFRLLKRPVAAVAIATAATLVCGEVAGCGSSDEHPTTVSITNATMGPRVQESIPSQPATPAQPANIWAGYVALAPKQVQYTSVHGTFTIPKIVCDPTDTTAPGESYAQWVGLDGWGNKTVEQIGVTADCIDKNAPSKGDKGGKGEAPYSGPHDYEPTYYAWWMNYGGGDYSRTLSFPVHPGDRVDASVTYAGGDTFDMRLDNETTSRSYQQSSTCRVENVGGPCARAMADWIVERAGNSALGDFGAATFENATASTGDAPKTQRSIANLDGFAINMVQNGQVLATTSGLSGDGEAFNVFYQQHGQPGD